MDDRLTITGCGAYTITEADVSSDAEFALCQDGTVTRVCMAEGGLTNTALSDVVVLDVQGSCDVTIVGWPRTLKEIRLSGQGTISFIISASWNVSHISVYLAGVGAIDLGGLLLPSSRFVLTGTGSISNFYAAGKCQVFGTGVGCVVGWRDPRVRVRVRKTEGCSVYIRSHRHNKRCRATKAAAAQCAVDGERPPMDWSTATADTPGTPDAVPCATTRGVTCVTDAAFATSPSASPAGPSVARKDTSPTGSAQSSGTHTAAHVPCAGSPWQLSHWIG